MEEFFFEEIPEHYVGGVTITVSGAKQNEDFQELKKLLQYETVSNLLQKLRE